VLQVSRVGGICSYYVLDASRQQLAMWTT